MPAAAEDEDREGLTLTRHRLRLVGQAASPDGTPDSRPARSAPVGPDRSAGSGPSDAAPPTGPHPGQAGPAQAGPVQDEQTQAQAGPARAEHSEHREHSHQGEHGEHHEHHHHHILIEPEEDRWEWRRKIRQSRRKLFFYRWAVALAGLLLVAAGVASGPLPGPGGIPLVLLGVAVWSSEFEWALKLMQWLKHQLHQFRLWSRRRQIVFWAAFFAGCGLLGYTYLLIIGVPGWLPQVAAATLRQLPGV